VKEKPNLFKGWQFTSYHILYGATEAGGSPRSIGSVNPYPDTC